MKALIKSKIVLSLATLVVVAAITIPLLGKITPLRAASASSQASWSIVPSPNPSTSYNFLNSVSASDATHAWTVGSDADADNMHHGLIEYWNGTNWTQQTVVNVTGAIDTYLNSVKALNSSDVWAVGSYLDGNNSSHVLIEHSEDGGESWVQDTDSYTGGVISLQSMVTL